MVLCSMCQDPCDCIALWRLAEGGVVCRDKDELVQVLQSRLHLAQQQAAAKPEAARLASPSPAQHDQVVGP